MPGLGLEAAPPSAGALQVFPWKPLVGVISGRPQGVADPYSIGSAHAYRIKRQKSPVYLISISYLSLTYLVSISDYPISMGRDYYDIKTIFL